MIEKRYIFKANAIGAGATIRRADAGKESDHTVPALAVASLPVIGGRSEGKVQNFCFSAASQDAPSILSVRHAHSHTEGRVDPKKGACSEAHTEVQGWSLLGKVRVERMIAHLDSVQGPDDRHPLVRPRGNVIEGLSVEGHELKLVLDERLFAKFDSKQALLDEYARNSELQNKYAFRFNAEPGDKAPPQTSGGYMVCSLVKSMRWAGEPHPTAKIDGYKLRWPGFGTIYVGEILVGEGIRRVTLIRVELEAPVEPPRGNARRLLALAAADAGGGGSANGGDVVSNGTTMP